MIEIIFASSLIKIIAMDPPSQQYVKVQLLPRFYVNYSLGSISSG